MKSYQKLFQKITQQVKENQQNKNYKKFRKIDTHEHVGDKADFDKFLEIMDDFNIEKVFLMPTGKDYKREKLALEMTKKYPKQFTTFAFLNETNKTAKDHLKASIEKGAKGLKLLLWHPTIYVNNKIRMDANGPFNLFEICQKTKIPVLAHMSPRNFPEHWEQLENTLKAFPDLLFIIPHYLGTAPDLKVVGNMLDKYSNLYTDISMGGGKNRYVAFIQGFRKRFRDFFKKYNKRLFWGTDLFIEKKSSQSTQFYHRRIQHDINMLDERFFYSHFYQENRYLFGLNLADWILENVFYNNAKRVLLKGGESYV